MGSNKKSKANFIIFSMEYENNRLLKDVLLV